MYVFLPICDELHLLSDLKVTETGFRISFPFKLETWNFNIFGPRKEKGSGTVTEGQSREVEKNLRMQARCLRHKERIFGPYHLLPLSQLAAILMLKEGSG